MTEKKQQQFNLVTTISSILSVLIISGLGFASTKLYDRFDKGMTKIDTISVSLILFKQEYNNYVVQHAKFETRVEKLETCDTKQDNRINNLEYKTFGRTYSKRINLNK